MARVRTEEKRRQIIAVASQLFEELGYDRTSMSLISEKLGGSKATLYGYFKSKEELLDSVLVYDVQEQADQLMKEFLAGKDVREGLIKLGIAYMTRRLSSTPIANVRMVANQPSGSDVGKRFYETVLGPAWQRLANRFQMLMDAGLLKRADPWIAGMQWKGLCEWDMFERRLLGAIPAGDPKEIERAVVTGTDAFLQLYGTEKGKRRSKGQKAKQMAKAVSADRRD